MKKVSEIGSIINILLSVFMVYVIIELFMTLDNGWAAIGAMIIALFMLGVALVLLIPFIYFLVKLKYQNMRWFFYSYLTFLFLCIFTFIASFVSAR